MNEGHSSEDIPAVLPGRRWSSPGLTVAAAMLIGVVGLSMVRCASDAQIRGDETYGWVLRFPGIPPGASFKTTPGDDLAATLDTVLPEDSSQWQSLLAHGGEIDIRLSCYVPRRVPLVTRIAWWRMDHRWRRSVANVGFACPVVRIRQLPSSVYEVVRISAGKVERVAEPVDRFEQAKQVMVAELAKMIDTFQKGETIEGMSGMLPADP